MEEQTYTSNQASRMAGVTLRQIQWWDEQNLVSPAQNGHTRTYTSQEVEKLTLIAKLRKRGIPLQQIRSLVRGYNPLHEHPLWFIVQLKGWRSCSCYNPGAALTMLETAKGPVIVVKLDRPKEWVLGGRY